MPYGSELLNGNFSTGDTFERMGKGNYSIIPPGTIDPEGLAERKLLLTKNKILPPWLKLAFPINATPVPLGKTTVGATEPGSAVENKKGPGGNVAPSAGINFALPTKYSVVIVPPAKLNYQYGDDFAASITNAVLPGKTLTTSDDRQGSPNVIKTPYDIVYDDVVLTFRLTVPNMPEFDLISRWIDLQYSEDKKAFAYHDTYKADIVIIQYDANRNPIKKIKLIDAYPIIQSEISLGYDMNDAIETFTTTFAYTNWIEVKN